MGSGSYLGLFCQRHNHTIEKQLVRSTDSISANLSEGNGHFHFKENINFCYYSHSFLQ
ncbi:four helix bundle protein [Spirosoma pulveris]